jgi:hypothetical protein
MKEKTLEDYKNDEKLEELKVLLSEMDYCTLYHKAKNLWDQNIIRMLKKNIYLWYVGGLSEEEIDTKLQEWHLNPRAMTNIDDDLKLYFNEAIDFRDNFKNGE